MSCVTDRNTNVSIAKVLRTVGSAGSVHSPAGATSLQCVGNIGGLYETATSDWFTFRCFETPAAVFFVCTLALEPAEWQKKTVLRADRPWRLPLCCSAEDGCAKAGTEAETP